MFTSTSVENLMLNRWHETIVHKKPTHHFITLMIQFHRDETFYVTV